MNSDQESSRSSISDDLSNTDGRGIFDVFGLQPILYKPLSYENREAIYMYLGFDVFGLQPILHKQLSYENREVIYI